jgi:HD superfamily phosphohydrolase
MMSQRERLVEKLLAVPLAKYVLEVLAAELIPLPVGRVRDSKEINDPIWKIIRLSPLEVSILDTPLMQRLRRVKQLGLAHLVYPGATHTRLEHSIGVNHVAKRMFGGLAATITLDENDQRKCGTLMGVAGLLHDCGHLTFSHLGERVLEDVLGADFATIRDIFADSFSGVVRIFRSDGTVSAPHPRPAELLSALFIISQPMVDLLNRQGDLGLPAEELVTAVASLVLGYAPESLVFGRLYLYFLKDIISGDIDADKIDYLARDGYFAGVPLAVDVERLLSQLAAIDLQPGSSAASFGLPARGVERIYAIGLKPTGASAMEMLVLTRVYLFDRIYLHHKVKAAERLCESMLRSYLLWLVQEAVTSTRSGVLDLDKVDRLVTQSLQEPSTLGRILTTMMRPGVDDGLLSEVLGLRGNSDPVAKEIGQAASDLLFRHLPVRALPVALRASARVDLPSGDRIAKIYWPHLKLSLASAEGKRRFEDRVIALCDDGNDLLFDYANRKPVPEDPDIWVSTSSDAAPERLNRYFSVEQLSNAYLELKETGWVFCNREHQATAAAATAVALYEQFGIIPSAHAMELGKVSADAYENALDDLRTRGKASRDVIDILKEKQIGPALVLHPFEIRGYLPKAWSADEIEQAANNMADKLTSVLFPRSAGA